MRIPLKRLCVHRPGNGKLFFSVTPGRAAGRGFSCQIVLAKDQSFFSKDFFRKTRIENADKMDTDTKIPNSFRDPSGFLFSRNGVLLRQINASYKENYDALFASGLYKHLVNQGLLIPHGEIATGAVPGPEAYKLIKPERIPFLSYAYEWSFSQLKDAALITLRMQRDALNHGMGLKDASTCNVQFLKGKPILIDTLSFEKYAEGRPWIAYRQFCQHFLAPLALMSLKDIRLNRLLINFADGIPLDLASALLPPRSYAKISLLAHIHLHSKFQKSFSNSFTHVRRDGMSKTGLLGLIDHLESAVRNLHFPGWKSEWSEYYDSEMKYSPDSFRHKENLVDRFLASLAPETLWDLGANTGHFSRIAGKKGIRVISIDLDPIAVEKNYLRSKSLHETNILPLVMDLSNPSPKTGWENQETLSLPERGPADTAIALALIHHLAISSNLPFERIASCFSKLCRSLIIEFVPKDDTQARKLLASRDDIFSNYSIGAFESEFSKFFSIEAREPIDGSQRTLYLMRKK